MNKKAFIELMIMGKRAVFILPLLLFLISSKVFSETAVVSERTTIVQQLDKESLLELLPIYYVMLTKDIDVPFSVSFGEGQADFYDKYKFMAEKTGNPLDPHETRLLKDCEESGKASECSHSVGTVNQLIDVIGGRRNPSELRFQGYPVPFAVPPEDRISFHAVNSRTYLSDENGLLSNKMAFVNLVETIFRAKALVESLTVPSGHSVDNRLFALANAIPYMREFVADLNIYILYSERVYSRILESMYENAEPLFSEKLHFNLRLSQDSDMKDIQDFLERSGFYEEKKSLLQSRQEVPLYKFFNEYLQPNIESVVPGPTGAISKGIFFPQGGAMNPDGRLIPNSRNYLNTSNGNCATWAFMASNLPGHFGRDYYWDDTLDILAQNFEEVPMEQRKFGDLVFWNLGVVFTPEGSFSDFHIFMYLGRDSFTSEEFVFTKNGRGFVSPGFMKLNDVKDFYKNNSSNGIVKRKAYRLRKVDS